MDSMLSILLVEDDPIFAEELQNRLLASVGDVAGVHAASDALTARQVLAGSIPPDLAILDLSIPDREGGRPTMKNGVAVIDAIAAQAPRARRVVLDRTSYLEKSEKDNRTPNLRGILDLV